MDNYEVKIISNTKIAHNTNKIKVEKPAGYKFIPGQGAYVSINTQDLKNEERPFSFTGLPEWKELEFIIKSYEKDNEITNKLNKLKPGSELLIGKAWGDIKYKGMGMFIAGGTGITPFISILRDLKQKNNLAGNSLIYLNKTESDIILKDELEEMLGSEAAFLLSREKNNKYFHGRIDELVLRMFIVDYVRDFYVCGPEAFVKDITSMLKELGADADSIIFEDTSLVDNFNL
ncbi:MAG: flavodoxin reductase [Ignavibacteriae bacterium]|nr:flavodoxin reductase [Ignavibacteriota bacterium]NOG98596.1 flavodoxin reductase [Ignavibacteriota bacterium]